MEYTDGRELANEETGDPTPSSAGVEEDAPQPEPEEVNQDLPALPDGLPALPKTAAVRRLASSLVAYGFSEGAATAIARAIARPEEARKRLQNPDIMRVPGGVLATITTQVWAPAVCHYPGNNREASHRIYPLSGALQAGQYPPLRELDSVSGVTGELVLQAQSRAHVVSSLNKSNAFLARHNDLSETIGHHGILREVLLTVVKIEHEAEGEQPAWTLAGADGSSRISASHRIHHLGADEVVYGLPGDDRKYRGYISDVLAAGQKPRGEVTIGDVQQARSLVVPATLVLKFEPESNSDLRFDQAVRFIVGITHVEPPKPWGVASENDALADPVIEEFLHQGKVTRARAQWYAAALTPERAQEHALDPHADSRVAEIAAMFLPKDNQRTFRRGVLRITAKSKVTSDFKSKVVTEMILRPWRAQHTDADGVERVGGVRSVLQRILKWPALQASDWHVSVDNDPDKMLELALRGLVENGTAGNAGVELGVRGGYYLALHGSMVRDAHGRTVDFRTPSSVLQRMTENEHGLRTLHRAVIDGRLGRAPQSVDGNGAVRVNANNQPITANDEWLRRSFPAVGESVESPPVEGATETPESAFETAKNQVAGLVASLESALTGAESVPGHSRPLVKEQGWPQAHAEDLASRLDKICARLRMYAAIAEVAEEALTEETGGDDEAN
ncbi:hypothetical protein [Streptomyces xinghaiensis]|uniref:hypothetical protein n=1 Tax=Streptomyces xinghaiensis TaxID=1038928 RepID=UPI00343CB392